LISFQFILPHAMYSSCVNFSNVNTSQHICNIHIILLIKNFCVVCFRQAYKLSHSYVLILYECHNLIIDGLVQD